MHSLIDVCTGELPCPEEALLDEARRAIRDPSVHERLLARIEALHVLEARSPREAAACPDRLRIAALNAERLKRPDAVKAMREHSGADVLLLSEADVGMARSGNVHTIRELIGSSGDGYLYGVEFVELDLGDAEEMRRHAGERNSCGFHGNAIVSSLVVERPHLIPLEESGRWFTGFKDAQRRVGRRIALAARIAHSPRPLWVVGLHLESKTDPADRQVQVGNLLRALDHLAPNEACIVGGDFNTKALPRGEEAQHTLFEEPDRHEPLFADFRAAGFSWTGANLPVPTQRDGPWKTHPRPLGKFDWFFVRGVRAENPQVVPSLDVQGQPVSDHEMLIVDLVF